MPKHVTVDGKSFIVPDDATPDEIDQISQGGSAPMNAPQGALSSFLDETGLPGVGHAIMHLPATIAAIPQAAKNAFSDSASRLTDAKNYAKQGSYGAALTSAALATPIVGGFMERQMDRATPDQGLLPNAAQIAGAAGGIAGLWGPEGVTKAAGAIAPKIAETALGVRGSDRLYGRTVGDAILEDTNGVRPATIESSARGKLSELKPQLEALTDAATQGGERGSLAPSRTTVANKIADFNTNRATESAASLKPMQDWLSRDAVTGLPLAEQQTPRGLLNMKRGFDADFVRNWKPGQPDAVLSTARNAYGDLASEFHNATPGAENLDQRISSLIPVAQRAETTALNAGTTQQFLNKFKVPTGALSSIGLGAAGGAEHGIPGMVAGAAMGAGIPLIVSSPTTQMIAARGLNALTKPAVRATMFSPSATNAVINPLFAGTRNQ